MSVNVIVINIIMIIIVVIIVMSVTMLAYDRYEKHYQQTNYLYVPKPCAVGTLQGRVQ